MALLGAALVLALAGIVDVALFRPQLDGRVGGVRVIAATFIDAAGRPS
jgi:hypothetical protein